MMQPELIIKTNILLPIVGQLWSNDELALFFPVWLYFLEIILRNIQKDGVRLFTLKSWNIDCYCNSSPNFFLS